MIWNNTPVDEADYLVSWYDASEGEYSKPIRAYYTEGHFFATSMPIGFPLKVDRWLRLPDPNED